MTGSAPFGCWGCNLRPGEHWKCIDRSAGRYDRHHLIPQQTIRREYPHGAAFDGQWKPVPRCFMPLPDIAFRTLDDLLADSRNIVQVGRWHHAQIEAHMLNPTWADLPADAIRFAAELGLAHLLERRYPMEQAA